jgi:hypothetical protein
LGIFFVKTSPKINLNKPDILSLNSQILINNLWGKKILFGKAPFFGDFFDKTSGHTGGGRASLKLETNSTGLASL